MDFYSVGQFVSGPGWRHLRRTGNGPACSWYEFTKKIMEYSGISATVTPCTTEEYPTPAKRPAYSVLDNCMLRVTVGDEMRDWQEALKCYIEKIDEK